jgi:hypothetical protein
MSVLAILAISSLFVLAAIVGLADALVHFICWSASRLTARPTRPASVQAPRHGITA